jgi:hypothetical protein
MMRMDNDTKNVGALKGKQSEGWRRIRVGMAGVAGILLLLALGSAMLDRLGLENQNNSPANTVASANGTDLPSEPMAELGVAPGAAEPVAANK